MLNNNYIQDEKIKLQMAGDKIIQWIIECFDYGFNGTWSNEYLEDNFVGCRIYKNSKIGYLSFEDILKEQELEFSKYNYSEILKYIRNYFDLKPQDGSKVKINESNEFIDVFLTSN